MLPTRLTTSAVIVTATATDQPRGKNMLCGGRCCKLLTDANAPNGGARHASDTEESVSKNLGGDQRHDGAGGASTSQARGKQARLNDRYREIAAELGISVRKARSVYARSAVKRNNRVKSATRGKSDAAWVKSRMGLVRADGSLQHIGGRAGNHRRIPGETAEARLYDWLLKTVVPKLQQQIAAAARKAAKVESARQRTMPRPAVAHGGIARAGAAIADQRLADAEAAFAAAVRKAAPNANRHWATNLAAAILADQAAGRSGWGGYKRGLRRLKRDRDLVAQLVADTGYDPS